MSEVETASAVLEEEEETLQEAGGEHAWTDEHERVEVEEWRDAGETEDQQGSAAAETFDDWFGLDDRHIVTRSGHLGPSEIEGSDLELYVDGEPLSRALDDVGLVFYRDVFLPQLLATGRASFRGAVENGEVIDGSVTELHGMEATITFGARVRAEDRWCEDELFLPPFEKHASSDAAVPDTTVHQAPLELILDEAMLANVRVDREVALTTEPATVFETAPHTDLDYAAGAEVETTSPGGWEHVHTPEPAAAQSARSLMIESVAEEPTSRETPETPAADRDTQAPAQPDFAHSARVEEEPPAEKALAEPVTDAARAATPRATERENEAQEISRDSAPVEQPADASAQRETTHQHDVERASTVRLDAPRAAGAARSEKGMPGMPANAVEESAPDAAGHAREEEIERSYAAVPEQRVPPRARDDKLTSLREAVEITRVHAENPEWQERAERAPGVDRTANRLPDALGSVPYEVSSESRRMIESVAEEPTRRETPETPAADRDAHGPAQPDVESRARIDEPPAERALEEPVMHAVRAATARAAERAQKPQEISRSSVPVKENARASAQQEIMHQQDVERTSTGRVDASHAADAESSERGMPGVPESAAEEPAPGAAEHARRPAREQDSAMVEEDARPLVPRQRHPASERESVPLGTRSTPLFPAPANVPVTLPATRAAGTAA